MWARHDVHAMMSGVNRYHHPLVGDLDLDYQTLAINGAIGQTMHVFLTQPSTVVSDSMRLLRALQTTISTERPRDGQVGTIAGSEDRAVARLFPDPSRSASTHS